MILSTLLVALLPVVCVLAEPIPNFNTCKDGPITLKGRQCVRSCGYEFTSGSYKSDIRSCFDECAQACAADTRCNSAKWSRTSKKCYYNTNKSPYWQKTGRGDGIKCSQLKPKTTTKCTTTTKSSSSSVTSTTTRATTPSTTTASTSPSTTTTSSAATTTASTTSTITTSSTTTVEPTTTSTSTMTTESTTTSSTTTAESTTTSTSTTSAESTTTTSSTTTTESSTSTSTITTEVTTTTTTTTSTTSTTTTTTSSMPSPTCGVSALIPGGYPGRIAYDYTLPPTFATCKAECLASANPPTGSRGRCLIFGVPKNPGQDAYCLLVYGRANNPNIDPTVMGLFLTDSPNAALWYDESCPPLVL